MRVKFSFATATPAALFRRADAVWLVFDSLRPIDIEQIRSKGGAVIAEVSQLPLDRGQAIRIRLNRPQMPSLTGEVEAGGANWTLTFADTMQTPPQPLMVIRNVADRAVVQTRRSASNCRSGRRRYADGDHGAAADSRLRQAAGFCRAVAARIDPRRGGSSEL